MLLNQLSRIHEHVEVKSLAKSVIKKKTQLPAWEGLTLRVSRLAKGTSVAYAAVVPSMSRERPN